MANLLPHFQKDTRQKGLGEQRLLRALTDNAGRALQPLLGEDHQDIPGDKGGGYWRCLYGVVRCY